MKPHLLRIFFLGWLLLLPLQGQVPALDGEKDTGRRAWIVVADSTESLANPLTVLTAEKVLKVQMFAREVGDPIPVDKTGVVKVVKVVNGPDGKVAYQNLAVAQLGEKVREALIVLIPKGEKEEGLMFKSNVIDLADFKKGGCLYVNLVKTHIGITIGDLKAKVPPGGIKFINALENQKDDVLPIRFVYEIPKDPKPDWKLMTASQIPLYMSRREICIFFFNKEIENVDFRGMTFITPPPKKRRKP